MIPVTGAVQPLLPCLFRFWAKGHEKMRGLIHHLMDVMPEGVPEQNMTPSVVFSGNQKEMPANKSTGCSRR